MSCSGLTAIDRIVVLMLGNRSFDHEPDKAVPVFKIHSTSNNACFMPGADPHLREFPAFQAAAGAGTLPASGNSQHRAPTIRYKALQVQAQNCD